MTDFTLPNGNTLRIDDDGSREIEKGTGLVMWPANVSGVVEGNTLRIGTPFRSRPMRFWRRMVNEMNRKRNRQ